MDGWMDGWMHACMHACIHGWMHEWMEGSGYSDMTVVPMPTCYPTVILLVIIVRHFRLSYRIRAFHSLSNLGGIEKRKMDLLASYNDENVEDSPSTVSEKQVNRFLIPSKYRFDQIVIKFRFSDPLTEPEKKNMASKR